MLSWFFAFALMLSLTGGLSAVPSSLPTNKSKFRTSNTYFKRWYRNRNGSSIDVDVSCSQALVSSEIFEDTDNERHLKNDLYWNYNSRGGFQIATDENRDKSLTGISVALFAAHFGAMAAKCSLPCSFALLLSPDSGMNFAPSSSPQFQMSMLLFLSTLSIATGKICFGPIIDKVGGVASLKTLLILLSVLLSIVGLTTSFTTFTVCWILVDACFSTCWPGCLKCVYQTFSSDLWSKKVGMLAMAARAGNAAAFWTFGALLQLLSGKSYSWRVVFGLSALMQLIPLSLLQHFGGDIGDQHKELDDPKIVSKLKGSMQNKETFRVLFREARTLDFWLVLISRSSLMIFGNFLLFVPTFMTHGYSVSHALSSKVASMFAVGCLLSVSICSQVYNDLSVNKQIALITGLCGTSFLCALSQLLHSMNIVKCTPLVGSLIMMIWGFSFSVPFYIPPALFALKRGGQESSATIADAFDVGAFVGLSFFNGYVASIRHDALSSWITTFKILVASASITLFSLPTAIWIGDKRK